TGFYELTGVPGILVLNHSGAIPDLDEAIDQLFRDECIAVPYRADGKAADGRLAAFTGFLSRLASRAKGSPKYLTDAVSQFEAANGAIKVAEVVADLGVGQRQLDREFKRIVGVSPKYFCSALQLGKALMALFENDDAYLTELAGDAGYYDQSHFIAAMQRFVAQSPGKFLESETSLLASFLRQNRNSPGA
ncbi:MAG: helix-turn-helix domain-containing protein, partial [Pseudomonadota bacterium]